jgi:hypothetical protein
MTGFDLVVESGFERRFKLVIRRFHDFEHPVRLGPTLEQNMQLLLALFVAHFALGLLWLKLLR